MRTRWKEGRLGAPQVEFLYRHRVTAADAMETLAMDGPTDGLQVRLFGGVRLLAAGKPIPLTPNQRALVALVYGHGREGLGRLDVARYLWGPDAAQQGRQRLRQLLFELRARVGRPILEATAQWILPSATVTSELGAFENALRSDALREAAHLIAQGFIAGGALPTENLEEWRDGRAARLRREVRSRAMARWAGATESDNWELARDAAEALLVLDPESREALERVILARGHSGDLEGAERAVADYRVRLPEDGELDPRLMRAVGAARSIRGIESSLPLDRPRVRFVGRQRVLTNARATLKATEAGGFNVLLVSGESGIGKTRLLTEIYREAAIQGFRCLRAHPAELERSIPLNCLLDALRDVDLEPHLAALGRPWSSVIASLLPPSALRESAEEPPPIQPSSLSRRLLDSFALLFERLARERPTALFLDDLQWADATTIATLQFLQRRWTDGSFGVFATLRPDLIRVTDPVAQYLTAGGLHSDSIELPALTTEEARELVDAITNGAIAEQATQRLCAIAGNHPLYLSELTREFLGGRLRLPERPSDELLIPSSLGRMLDARLEAMDDGALKVAGVLAVAARPMRTDVLAELVGLSLEAIVNAVDVLIEARFVELDRREVRIAHELFRSAVYRHLSEPRRAIHHRAVAQRLLCEAGDEFAGEAAVHFFRAGEDELAARYGWIAARRASEAGALPEAIQLYEVVAACERDAVKQADATSELATVLYLSRDITRANPLLSLAAERLRTTGRPSQARRLEIMRIEGLAEVAEAPVTELLEALSEIKREARETDDWESLALALDSELHLLHRAGDVDGIHRLLEEMRAVSTVRSLEARLLARAGLALGVFFDDPDEALRAAEEAVSLSEEGRAYRLRALNRLLVVLQARGVLTLPEASGYIAEARRLAERSGDLLARFSIESNIAVAYLDAGDHERAHSLMDRAWQISGAGDMDMNRFIQCFNEAELALSMKDFGEAATAFTHAANYLGPTTPTYMSDAVNAGLGYCALETGDLAEARRRADMLHEEPSCWYFDPTTIVCFRARLLETRGRRDEGIQLLARTVAHLSGRLPLAWLKVALLQVRLMAKQAPRDALKIANEMASRARELHLGRRAREFEAIAERLEG